MVYGLSMGILAIRLFDIHSIFYRFWFVPFIVLFVFPLCLHRNKQHLQCQSQQLIKKSRLATVALFFICIVLRFLNYATLYKASYLGVCLSAVSRICGLLIQNAHKIVKNWWSILLNLLRRFRKVVDECRAKWMWMVNCTWAIFGKMGMNTWSTKLAAYNGIRTL